MRPCNADIMFDEIEKCGSSHYNGNRTPRSPLILRHHPGVLFFHDQYVACQVACLGALRAQDSHDRHLPD